MEGVMNASSAAQLREEGNKLYKAGKLRSAVGKYEAATKIAPAGDALPFSNLSAALF